MAPLLNTVSTRLVSKLGWNSAPAVPATQWGGHDVLKSGSAEKWVPGST